MKRYKATTNLTIRSISELQYPQSLHLNILNIAVCKEPAYGSEISIRAPYISGVRTWLLKVKPKMVEIEAKDGGN